MPENNKTGRSLITPLAMMLLAGAAIVVLWTAMRRDHETRVADIVEAVSYAARSEMARQLIAQFRAFDLVRSFWSEYALTPVEQWEADASIEIDHFDGLEVIAWAEREGPRFFSAGPQIALSHTPSDEEWAMIQDSIEAAFGVEEETVIDPVLDGEGHAVMRLYLPVENSEREAVMIAIIDLTDQIDAVLVDQSPGYDILASCCNGIELFRTGDFDADIPESWLIGGFIEPIDGVIFRIQHQPSAELASDFRPWALNTVLGVGLALALSIGTITYHSRRADERARAARIAERQVRALNEELERRVEQRTRELNDALSDLNTIGLSVAHDVRTPLNAAGLTIESLLAANGGDGWAAFQLNRVKSGLAQINTILERLMALSSVSAFEAERRQTDMEQLARQVGGELIAEGQAMLTVGELPAAYVDPTMAHILLTNLIGNAIKHSAPGGAARIEIGARSDGDVTTYFVRDHGAGIDPAVRDELFKPAPARRVPSGNRDGTGLGLGLAIAARVCAQHGGAIWVEETEGGGATFCFRLPDSDGRGSPG
jgi:signal transduction histidine kinase